MTGVRREAEEKLAIELAHKFCEWFLRAHNSLPYGFHRDVKLLLIEAFQRREVAAFEAGHASAVAKYAKAVEAGRRMIKHHDEGYADCMRSDSRQTLIDLREALASIESLNSK